MAVQLRLRHLTGIRIENLDLEATTEKDATSRTSRGGLTAGTELLDADHSTGQGRARAISQSSTTSTIRPPFRRQTLSGDDSQTQIVEEALAESQELPAAPRSPVLQRTTSSGPQRRPTHLTHRSRSRLVIPREVELPDEAESPLLAKFRDLAFNPSVPSTNRVDEPIRPRSISISASASHLLGPTNVIAHHEEVHPRRARAGSNASLLLQPSSTILNSPEMNRETLEETQDHPPIASTEISIQRRLARCFVALSQLSDAVRAATHADLTSHGPSRSQSLDSGRVSKDQANGNNQQARSKTNGSSAPMRRISSASSAESTSTSSSSPASPGSPNGSGSGTTASSTALRRHSLASAAARAKTSRLNGGSNSSLAANSKKIQVKSTLRKSSPLSTICTNGDADSSSPALEQPSVPFFLSPIHPASTHPSFAALSARDDFADWLTDKVLANDGCSVEVWIDALEPRIESSEDGQWTRFQDCCRQVRFADLLPLSNRNPSDDALPRNRLVFTFRVKGIDRDYYLPQSASGSPHPGGSSTHASSPAGSSTPVHPMTTQELLAKTMRETQMRKSLSMDGVRRLVELQVELRRARADAARVQLEVDEQIGKRRAQTQRVGHQDDPSAGSSLLTETSQARLRQQHAVRIALLRDWKRDVQNSVAQSHSFCQTLAGRLETRKNSLSLARQGMPLSEAMRDDVLMELESLRSETSRLESSGFERKAWAAHRLDDIFTIIPLDAQSLLYSILDIPLPIPRGKDEAPPLSIPANRLPPGYKVDEDTNASALGFAALLVHLLHTLLEMQVPYPVTCAGSRSVVRDNISIITGPRSFPLYSRGVDRFRYEYGVFLLNKNIESMMIASDIRIEDSRHTLPNLKTLLLTISSRQTPHERGGGGGASSHQEYVSRSSYEYP